jgi:hypothetical protein
VVNVLCWHHNRMDARFLFSIDTTMNTPTPEDDDLTPFQKIVTVLALILAVTQLIDLIVFFIK